MPPTDPSTHMTCDTQGNGLVLLKALEERQGSPVLTHRDLCALCPVPWACAPLPPLPGAQDTGAIITLLCHSPSTGSVGVAAHLREGGPTGPLSPVPASGRQACPRPTRPRGRACAGGSWGLAAAPPPPHRCCCPPHRCCEERAAWPEKPVFFFCTNGNRIQEKLPPSPRV